MKLNKPMTRIEKILAALPDKTAIESNLLHSKVFSGVRGELRSRISEIRNQGLANIDMAVKYNGKFFYVRDDNNVLTPVKKANLVKKASCNSFVGRMFGWCL